MPDPIKANKLKQKRPIAPNLVTAFTLDDLVYPDEIVGQRTRIKDQCNEQF